MRRALLIAAVLALLVAVPRGAQADRVDRPSLSVGDSWTYATNSTVVPGFVLQGQLTSRVDALGNVSVEGVSLDAFQVVLDGSGTASVTLPPSMGSLKVTGTWIVTGEEFLETSQLKVVKSLLGFTVTGTSPAPFSVQVQNTTTFRILEDAWRFPLTPGEVGSVTLAYRFTQSMYGSFFGSFNVSGNGTWSLAYSMGSPESVSTPAGAFSAFPINETWPDSSVDRLLFSAAVGNNVRTESYDATGSLVGTTVLLAYRYQSMEVPTFLGLTLGQWGVVAPVAAAGVIATVYIVCRGKRKKKDTAAEPEPTLPR